MCKKMLKVLDETTEQWRKTCPTHREKLRVGKGCSICGYGTWIGQTTKEDKDEEAEKKESAS